MTTPDETLTVTTQQLADLVAGTLDGPGDLALTNMAPISGGSPGSLTFIRDQAHARMWADSECSAALVSASVQVPDHDGADRTLIVVDDADIAFAKVLAHLDPGTAKPDIGIHPHASIHPTATVDQTAAIGPGCTVGPGATIGAGAVLIAGVHIGAGVSVGEETVMHPGVVLCDRCTIGARGLIHPNVVIGADGFGFIPPENGRPAIKVPQIGHVRIGDDVEIGAGSTIDRAKIGVTVIGSRVKLDNLVHIGHNCDIGDDAILCGRTTLGGSSLVGTGAMVGGAVVVSDQTAIGAHAKVAGGSMVLEEVPSGETYAGIPAMPARKALANHGAMRTIADFVRRVDKTLSKLDPDYSSRGKR